MIIAVLDTNVLVSALLSPRGSPAEIIRRWEAEEFNIVTSPPLLNELERVLTYPRVRKYLKLSEDEISQFLQSLRVTATVVEPDFQLQVIEADPDDDRVLECAVAGRATYIISGNSHLLQLAEYKGIQVLSPTGFLALLQANA